MHTYYVNYYTYYVTYCDPPRSQHVSHFVPRWFTFDERDGVGKTDMRNSIVAPETI